jgi:hypothetical protein
MEDVFTKRVLHENFNLECFWSIRFFFAILSQGVFVELS